MRAERKNLIKSRKSLFSLRKAISSEANDFIRFIYETVRKYRLIFIVASTLLSAAAVCLGGLIGWVGLMIPHLARALVGVDYRRLIPASAILGGGYLILVDDISRSLLSMELPLGVVTSIMGAPFFIYLIIKRKERA